MNELALFAGAGGGILGGKLLGWRTVCAVEINAYCRRVLMQRQDDGCLPAFPIWDDVTTFDGRPWAGLVDVVSGGFPCQDISSAGKGAGLAGERSGLWSEMARIVGEVRPRFVLVENSPFLVRRGLDRVLGDLAAMGFDARWGVVSAADAIWSAGTPILDHERERIWIVATNADGARVQPGRSKQRAERKRAGKGRKSLSPAANRAGARQEDQHEFVGVEASRTGVIELGSPTSDGHSARREEQRRTVAGPPQHAAAERSGWWQSEPAVGRVAHGVADRVDRLRALGNGQVPAVVQLAWRLLTV